MWIKYDVNTTLFSVISVNQILRLSCCQRATLLISPLLHPSYCQIANVNNLKFIISIIQTIILYIKVMASLWRGGGGGEEGRGGGGGGGGGGGNIYIPHPSIQI